MLLGSGALRILALAQVVFGARQGLGRVEDPALHAVASLGLLRGLPVAAPGPGGAEGGDVRGQQRRANQRPDPGAEAVEQQAGHDGQSGRSTVCPASAWVQSARNWIRPAVTKEWQQTQSQGQSGSPDLSQCFPCGSK